MRLHDRQLAGALEGQAVQVRRGAELKGWNYVSRPSVRNRSAGCRIPLASSPKGKRVEVRYPDPLANPYLAFAAMLMAGLDGIKKLEGWSAPLLLLGGLVLLVWAANAAGSKGRPAASAASTSATRSLA